MNLPLPPAVRAYFEAANNADPAAGAACFGTLGRVRDEARDHIGREAIQAWMLDNQRRYNVEARPISIMEEGGQSIVSVRLTGDFPSAPTVLMFRFSLARHEIASLDIAS